MERLGGVIKEGLSVIMIYSVPYLTQVGHCAGSHSEMANSVPLLINGSLWDSGMPCGGSRQEPKELLSFLLPYAYLELWTAENRLYIMR